MKRPYNFSAGPAALPQEVLEQAAAEMLDWHGSGMSVMEMSHRGREFMSIRDQAETDLRELLDVPSHYHVLFMQGGGIAENAIVPLNLSRGGTVDFVVTGGWSAKSYKEAKRYCRARVAASSEADGYTRIPAQWQLSERPSYVHVCTNETIHGVEFQELPDLKALGCDAPLVIDCSSHIASRPIDWSRVGLAFAGAQKNIGPAGLTLVIVREDLVGHALEICPSAFDYKTVAENHSMYNTPPTYAIYTAGLVFQWLKRQGGVAEMERRARAKAELLYGYIDASGWYVNKVDPTCRSRMNVPFFLPDDRLNEAFLAGAKERGLLQLKGHKSVGGMRASIYNAMPLEGVQALVDYMREFAARHG
ncbi:3-phosphoserine/phosphohydroxythreonine transaminase [Caldimonas thermodepolymerans]|jgi:phosphoserine aminotransferase|uniref:Phosphoserine aminotransferase n=1 Tax=Caldimonas thermodepolymerans TaxID=215580 RepID=A0A2S5T365_9BURK|nr:3-phosphoserine/phosphohydroxythreonine transaminase [Caldimonas thermodepolymerans]PPE69412.1 3-phosphoserine/phosphohydroxythreonine transaminase [Caldimonas thermodepolymerans]QPC32763.1 3-phosphoserine/phosphohydroxythreonine transaminase [Caldimonas thermodepolymerans]RDI03526.1 phosphoserine aminotransferase [Caldimonas thermodepolymerans]TCP06615.1 phosphoserine aminotransferase [Caldimonas thermodepolymerans]UZG45572.1 3-phosphoserine/phosphohydroxythreonine transaminase [Caldimonas